MNNRVRFTGSHVLITGAGSGIGRLMAIGAARRGARVTIWDLSEERGTRVRDEIRAFGGQAQARTIDITDRVEVEAAATDTGPVDILINNAGIVTGKRLLDADPDAIQRTFAVNTLSLYWMTRAFLGGMLQRDRGTVVTIASAAGLVGVARQTDYSASKFAAFRIQRVAACRAPHRGQRGADADRVSVLRQHRHVRGSQDEVPVPAADPRRGRRRGEHPHSGGPRQGAADHARSGASPAQRTNVPGSRFRRDHERSRSQPYDGSFRRTTWLTRWARARPPGRSVGAIRMGSRPGGGDVDDRGNLAPDDDPW